MSSLQLFLLHAAFLWHAYRAANSWIDYTIGSRSYYYHDTCVPWNKNNVQSTCSNLGGDGVASIRNSAEWTFIKNNVINSPPQGSCEDFGLGHSYIGVGATSANSCSASDKRYGYTYWNGEPYNSNLFSWNNGGTLFACNTENALHIVYTSNFAMDDAPWNANYAILCYRDIPPSTEIS